MNLFRFSCKASVYKGIFDPEAYKALPAMLLSEGLNIPANALSEGLNKPASVPSPAHRNR